VKTFFNIDLVEVENHTNSKKKIVIIFFGQHNVFHPQEKFTSATK
jgi:hypothetical protein